MIKPDHNPVGATPDEQQELDRLRKRVAFDNEGRLIPQSIPSSVWRSWQPRFSIADLLAILTLTPINMVLARTIDPVDGLVSSISAGLLTIIWLVAMHRGRDDVKKLLASRRGWLAWWFVRILPSLVLALTCWLEQLPINGPIDLPEGFDHPPFL